MCNIYMQSNLRKRDISIRRVQLYSADVRGGQGRFGNSWMFSGSVKGSPPSALRSIRTPESLACLYRASSRRYEPSAKNTVIKEPILSLLCKKNILKTYLFLAKKDILRAEFTYLKNVFQVVPRPKKICYTVIGNRYCMLLALLVCDKEKELYRLINIFKK